MAQRQGNISRVRKHVEHSYGVFPVVVSRVERLSESFVRVSLTGPALQYAVVEVARGTGGLQDAYVKLLVPPPGQSSPVRIDLTPSWRQDWFALPETIRGWMRTYTLRASRLVVPSQTIAGKIRELPAVPDVPKAFTGELTPEPVPDNHLPEVDIDFVLHTETDAEGAQCMGPGTRWAANARVGDTVSLMCPFNGYSLWASWDAGCARELILAVDETAVPAALSILSDYAAVPGGAGGSPRIQLIAWAPHPDDTAQALWAGAYPHLPAFAEIPGDLHTRWLTPQGETASGAQRSDMLEAALRQTLGVAQPVMGASGSIQEPLAPDELVWGVADDRHAQRYVFIAGEASMVKRLRRVCVWEAGLPKGQVSFMGYWRVGKTES
ncbi:MAG: siderophore-interacting protein [Rothia sp. (in: high G+C Gram-positive bacteria)]|uniref:siderophore-interacting protein n=1 Tax=Rothia sp. (in: high G+C Gram-positive bacteria) TaxID=1885016 RepID=UPI0026DD4DF0|nr:siderophore-interacting protein [Rothia sp. (in: high G+C Gram-positive bacteria)]MDO4885045.1 siderophore-interacting protein [Rothia sp. (in: high G+C Gram-positive bacteria)]